MGGTTVRLATQTDKSRTKTGSVFPVGDVLTQGLEALNPILALRLGLLYRSHDWPMHDGV